MDVTVNLFNAFSDINALAPQKVSKYLHKLKQKSPAVHDQLVAMLSKTDKSGFLTNIINNTYSKSLNDPEALIGLKINDYTLTEILGVGGMGAVYKAQISKEIFNKTFAIKIVFSHFSNILGEQGVMREATIMSYLIHPNIGEVIDLGISDEGYHYIVMEYINGSDIITHIQKNNIHVSKFYSLLLNICDAIHFAHQSTIIHSDLKPSNILVTDDGQPKVIDFGIAQLIKKEPANNTSVDSTPQLKGITKKYASPELSAGKVVGTFSDIFSLGILFKECLDTYLNSPKVQEKISSDNIKELAWLFKKAAHTNPENRITSVSELSRQIKRIQNNYIADGFKSNWLYKFKKLIFKRNPVLSTAIFIILLSFSVLFVNIVRSNIEIKAQKEQSDIVANSLSRIFTISDPNVRNGKAIFAENLLRDGQKLIENKNLNPVTYARISMAIADSYMGINKYDEAQKIYLTIVKTLDSTKNSQLVYKAAEHLLNLAKHASIPEKIIKTLHPLAKQAFTKLPSQIEEAQFYVNFLSNQQILQTGGYKGEFSQRSQIILKYMLDNFQNNMDAKETIKVMYNLATNYYYSLPSNAHHTFFQLNQGNNHRKKVLNDAYYLLQQALKITEDKIKEKTKIAKLNLWLARIEGELGQFKLANQRVNKALNTFLNILGKKHRDTQSAYTIGMLVNYYSAPHKSLEYAQKAYQFTDNEGFNMTEKSQYGHIFLDLLAKNGEIKQFQTLYPVLIKSLLAANKPVGDFQTNFYVVIVEDYIYTLNAAPANSKQLIKAFNLQIPKLTIEPIKIRALEIIEKLKFLTQKNIDLSKLQENYAFYAKPLKHQTEHINNFELNLDLMLHANYCLMHNQINKAEQLFSKINYTWSAQELKDSIILLRYRMLQAWLITETPQNTNIPKLINIINVIQSQLERYQLSSNNTLIGELWLLKARLAQLQSKTNDAKIYINKSEKIMSQQNINNFDYNKKLEKVKYLEQHGI